MTRAAIILFLSVSACGVAPERFDVPKDLRSCPLGVAPSPAPPLPRTTETIAKAYNKEKLAAETTYDALRVCAYRLRRLNALLAGSK